jgi:hypothetical protein
VLILNKRIIAVAPDGYYVLARSAATVDNAAGIESH